MNFGLVAIDMLPRFIGRRKAVPNPKSMIGLSDTT